METSARNWIHSAPGPIERIEACFSGFAFAPHRHDTYAIGITLSGVQSFHYRGSTCHSLPGQILVLHPDEVHDGFAGDNGAFRYRTAYVAPRDFQSVLGGRALPFLRDGISDDQRLCVAVRALLGDYEDALSPLGWDDALFDLVTALEDVCGPSRALGRTNRDAALTARDYIDARLAHDLTLSDLERATGQDRWQLSRDFRVLLGTSPYRYLMLRRLDRARRMLRAGSELAVVATACGFSDQSHFGRKFKQAFGLTPKTWQEMAIAHNRSIHMG